MEISFGAFLRQKRLEKNLTQKELAKALFVSESAISKWEKDVARPDITLILKLSEILGVSEHELLTASVDNKAREERAQAKKWRALSLSWNLFFYIAYAITVLTCFICNLAVEKALSWFWIVVSALTLAFTFTNLPKYIKKFKLIFIPLSQYLALVLLFGVCCIYSGGDWFWIPTFAVLLGLIIVFTPIYIAKYDVFSKVRRYGDFISVAIDYVALNILLIVINAYTVVNGYSEGWWFFNVACPITTLVYLSLNLLLSVRFLRVNRFIKTGIVLFLVSLLAYLPPIFIKVKNPELQNEINSANVFLADLSSWQAGTTLENNINLIVCLSLLLISFVFLTVGIIYRRINRK